MTPTDNDLTIIRPLAALSLTVRDPSGRTRNVPLASGRMIIGRGADCSLVLEAGDQTASRRHAIITVDGPVASVENAGSANGVYVNDTRVERAMLRPGDVVRLGRTTLVVSAAAATPSSQPSPAPLFPGKASAVPRRPFGRSRARLALGLAALGALCLFFWLAVFSGDDAAPPRAPSEPSSQAAAPAAQSVEAPPAQAEVRVREAAPETSEATNVPETSEAAGAPEEPKISPESAEQSLEHARQALFFYNSGKIGRAIDEWEKAVTLDPGNSQAAKWLARAAGERDQLLDKYYRDGLTALKYSRLENATENFHFVIEQCREKTDERCLDAARQLERLEGKKP